MEALSILAFTLFMIYLLVLDIYMGRSGDKLPHPLWSLSLNLVIAIIWTWIFISWID